MGGEFTITFNEDGSYWYYEGSLSSYIGSGSWEITDDIVVLTENVKGSVIRLKIQDDAIVYSAENSDNFYYITVRDGDRFNLSE